MVLSEAEQKEIREALDKAQPAHYKRAEAIVDFICDVSGVSRVQLIEEKRRTRNVSRIRSIIIVEVNKRTELTTTEMAELLSVDHSTIVQSLKRSGVKKS